MMSEIEDFEANGAQMLWARIQLDFGPSGIELENLEPGEGIDENTPEARLRRELEQMIGAIAQAHAAKTTPALGEDDLAEMESLLNEPGKLESMVEQVLREEQEAEKTQQDGGAQLAEEELVGDPEEVDEDAAREAQERARLDAEIEQRISETTAEDVVNALMLASIDMGEVLVHEVSEDNVNLYVLCQAEDENLSTVHMSDSGEISVGQPFDIFVDALLEQLPVRGGICADQYSYSVGAPVTALGEELALSNDGTAAALVELQMAEIPAFIGQAPLVGPIAAAPADNGWSLITGDPVSLVNLLSIMNVPSIVAETAEGMQHLAFVFPGSSPAYEEGTVGQWMSKVVGSPDDTDLGSVLEFAWGAPKKMTRYVPRESAVLDYLWLLPGVLPEPLHDIRAAEETDNLTWLYGLDEQTSKRFANYVNDATSETGMESAVQVLSLPEELVKIASGAGDMQEFVGYREFTPEMTGMDLLKESVTAYPNGSDTFSAVSRELMRRPWLVTADGAAQLGAAGAFALWAARRAARGDNPRAAIVAAAALGASGSAELVLARVLRRLKAINFVQESATGQQPVSLMEELEAQLQPPAETAEGKQMPKVLRNAKALGQRAKDSAEGKLRRFFGA
ncbi:MAG: hypothetical protein Q3965_03420 [Rothia sp. (in: high G+C Gram-positive bacteria)]|nr:hypothetical protein [Rothia sp. (in: high G+C Gram-positive bacteria)]